ncbi:MAG: metallophosphoesterase family protein [Pseudomonadota bacterium]
MLIGAMSDLHGNLISLEAVLADMKDKSVESMICCGDLLALGPRPVEVLDLLQSFGNIQIIRGNTDRWMQLISSGQTGFEEKVINQMQPALLWTLERLGPRAESYLQQYPASLDLGIEGLRTFIRHGGLDSDMQRILPASDLTDLMQALEDAGCDIFMCGHTHVPFVRKNGRTTLINCGSASMPFDGTPQPSWVLMEIENKTLKARVFRLDYDREAAVRDLRQSGMPMSDTMIARIRNARM